jgi:hypothetical protein
VRLFIVRATSAPPDVEVKVARRTPAIVRTADDERDFFCLGDDAVAESLAARGWTVVPVKDGWYDDDTGGGVGVWGDGRYFELRDTLFTTVADAGQGRATPDR